MAAVEMTGPLVIKVQGMLSLTTSVRVASDKTIYGDRDVRSGFTGGGLNLTDSSNVIIRNLQISKATADEGDAITILRSKHVWIDHCELSSEKTGGNYDGLVDITHASDFITVSWTILRDHRDSSLIGHSESNMVEDTDHLTVTFHHNLFQNIQQRSPRFRFGQLHTYNNLFVGSPRDAGYPMTSQALGGSHYFIGMGIESKIVSEFNVFRYDTRTDPADITVGNLKGYQFSDHGSWVNGRRADLNAVAERKFKAAADAAKAAGGEVPEWATMQFTTDVGWTPADAYSYRPQRSADAVTATVLREAGAR
jgi:pectate lyase